MAQLVFVPQQIKKAQLTQLSGWANLILKEVAYTNGWDLKGYRNASMAVPQWFIITTNGMIVDVEGFVPGILPPAVVPANFIFSAPQTVTSDTGERWRLYGRMLDGCEVITGTLELDDLNSADSKLASNAAKFGSTIGEALKVGSRAINWDVDYAVLGKSGEILYAAGAIPLRISPTSVLDGGLSETTLVLQGRTFLLYARDILGADGKRAGRVVIPMDITGENRAVRLVKWFNLVTLGLFFCATAITFTVSMVRRRISLAEAISNGETDTIEFKSSLRWDYMLKRPNSQLEQAVIKTITGFMNGEGGNLYIGVADDKSILGLQADYDTFSRNKGRDTFERHLREILANRIGKDRVNMNLLIDFPARAGQEVCHVRVTRAKQPVFIDEGPDKLTFYCRDGNATRAFNAREAAHYVARHFKVA